MAGGRGDRVWRYPAGGFALASLPAVAPGSAFRPEGWAAEGAFGAFTWVGWFVTTGLSLTLLLVALGQAERARRGHRARTGWGRVAGASLVFGMLALGCYVAAAGSEWITQRPLAALLAAGAGLLGLRALASRLTFRGGNGGVDG